MTKFSLNIPAGFGPAFRHLLVLPFLLAALGLPLNDFAGFAACMAGVLLLLFSVPRRKYAMAGAAACLAFIALVSALLAPPAIEEGHNAFVPGYPQDEALKHALPGAVYDKAAKRFAEAYPETSRCDAKFPGCWLNADYRPQESRFSMAYAFSADSVWSGAKYSRQVYSVSFRDIAELRGGFSNDYLYYWFDSRSDVVRNGMPFVVFFEIPAAYAGGEICWTGTVFFEGESTFKEVSSGRETCETLIAGSKPLQVYGISPQGNDLAVTVSPPVGLAGWIYGLKAARIVFSLLALLAFFAPLRGKVIPLVAGSVVVTLLFLGSYQPDRHIYAYPYGHSVDKSEYPLDQSVFRAYHPLVADMDGFRHESFARDVLWNAKNGALARAAEGGEAVYFFMPGMRYLQAICLAIFGDSEYGPIFFACLTIAAIFYFVVTFTSVTTALALMFAFFAGPKILTDPFLFDLRDWIYVYIGHWADGAGAISLFVGLAILMRIGDGKLAPTAGALVAPGLLVSAAIFLRPNFAACGGVAVLWCLWYLRDKLPLPKLLLLAAGFLLTGLAALHNLVFGHELVLFTTAIKSSATLFASPAVWEKAVASAMGASVENGMAARDAVVAQTALWLNDLDPHHHFLPIRVVALALLPGIILLRRLRTWKNGLLLAMALIGHVVLLFFINNGRYGFIAWPSTLLLDVLVVGELSMIAAERLRNRRNRRALGAES